MQMYLQEGCPHVKQNSRLFICRNPQCNYHEIFDCKYTCRRAGPMTGTRNPCVRYSSNWSTTAWWATCATALQNSRLFMKATSSGMSLMSSGVKRCQSSAATSSLRGNAEQSPLSPVANTCQYLHFSQHSFLVPLFTSSNRKFRGKSSTK